MKKKYFTTMILLIFLAGCVPSKSSIDASLTSQLPSQISDSEGKTTTPVLTRTTTILEKPTQTETQLVNTMLGSEYAIETMMPLLEDPFNCEMPCVFGIIPGKTSIDSVHALFDPLGYDYREGKDTNSGRDFYSVAYESIIGRDSSLQFYSSNNTVMSIVIRPEIVRQNKDESIDWIGYAPEILIKKYGIPSRINFGVVVGDVNTTINMLLYFDKVSLIALYSGHDQTPVDYGIIQFCPHIYPIDRIKLWMGYSPPDQPQWESIPLEEATSLSIDQFSQLMLNDPANACIDIDSAAFHY